MQQIYETRCLWHAYFIIKSKCTAKGYCAELATDLHPPYVEELQTSNLRLTCALYSYEKVIKGTHKQYAQWLKHNITA